MQHQHNAVDKVANMTFSQLSSISINFGCHQTVLNHYLSQQLMNLKDDAVDEEQYSCLTADYVQHNVI